MGPPAVLKLPVGLNRDTSIRLSKDSTARVVIEPIPEKNKTCHINVHLKYNSIVALI